MDSKDQLLEMFKLQQQLNDETNGKNWENGYNKYNRLINWRRCIYMECAELIDSFNWKHWKDIKKDPNWENIKIEIVDIWHFVMSLGLEFYKNNNLGDIKNLVDAVNSLENFKNFNIPTPEENSLKDLEIIHLIEQLMKTVLDNKSFYEIADTFFQSALYCKLNFELLYKLYIAKNVLNKFRQDHGYKEGTYQKVWNGKEDNDVMLEILENRSLNATKLYQELLKRYRC